MLEEHRHWCPWITISCSPSTSPITDGSPILPVKTSTKASPAASAVQVDNVSSTAAEQKSQPKASLLNTKNHMPGWKVVLMTIFPAITRSIASPTVSQKQITKYADVFLMIIQNCI